MFTLSFDIRDGTRLAELDRQIEANRKRFLKDAADLTYKTLVPKVPVGWTGNARASIFKSFSADFALISTTDDPVKMKTIEGGRRAGAAPPPVSALIPWVAFAFGGDARDAFMVARAIGRRGIPGVRMFENTYNEVKGPIYDMGFRIVADL